MSTYAIGDLQGCFDAFRRLLDLCAFDPAQDQLWLTGDLVNRGTQSLETLRYVKSLGTSAITVLGNHDLYLLMVAEGHLAKRGRDDTLQAVLDAPDRASLMDWLRARALCHREGGYCLVHAGLLPQWTVADASALAAEVEATLQGPHYPHFLSELWGSTPSVWSNDLKGANRLRVIVNAMTRMRFCTREGEMEFRSKGGLDDAPKGYAPWFENPDRKSADHTLVVGHWSALGFRMTENLIALDSGYLWGGQLTAVRLEDRQIFQVECAPERRRPLR